MPSILTLNVPLRFWARSSPVWLIFPHSTESVKTVFPRFLEFSHRTAKICTVAEHFSHLISEPRKNSYDWLCTRHTEGSAWMDECELQLISPQWLFSSGKNLKDFSKISAWAPRQFSWKPASPSLERDEVFDTTDLGEERQRKGWVFSEAGHRNLPSVCILDETWQ